MQPPFGQSVDSLCHPWFTTTNLSYRFPILKLPPPPCAALLVFYLYIYIYVYVYVYVHVHYISAYICIYVNIKWYFWFVYLFTYIYITMYSHIYFWLLMSMSHTVQFLALMPERVYGLHTVSLGRASCLDQAEQRFWSDPPFNQFRKHWIALKPRFNSAQNHSKYLFFSI